MQIKYRSNLTCGICSIITGIILALITPQQIGEELSKTYGITSRTIPFALAAIFVISGCVLVFQSLVLKSDNIKIIEINKELKVLSYMAVLIVYMMTFQKSFLIATTLLGWATLAFAGTKKKLYYGIVFGCTCAIYIVFTQILHVRLP